MRRTLTFLHLLLVPLFAMAQFEQKISINLSGGVFTTIGAKTWMPDYGSSAEDEQPLQISNYRPGGCTSFGIQYNLNRHLSIQADVGVMYAGQWFYDDYDGHNYTEYRIWDLVDDEILLASGNNEFTLLNIGIGITPKYYLKPGKSVNPYLFWGISMNLTSTTFEDNEWNAYRDLGMLEEGDDVPDRANIESNTGLGLCPGFGLEFNVNDRIGFHVTAGYHYILLNEENFYVPEQNENMNAVTIQAGLKLSFLKSKDI